MTRPSHVPVREFSDVRATILAVGEFGERVAGVMTETATRVTAPYAGTWSDPAAVAAFGADADTGAIQHRLEAVFAAGSGPVILALWRPSRALCVRASELAFERGRVWLPVVMDHPHIRVGPLVAGGHGACFSCFEARQAQHDDQRATSTAVLKAYDLDSRLGPRGYLCHHARLAAGLAHVMLGGLDRPPSSLPGQVMSVNVLSFSIRAHRVVPMPGCPRCGRPRRRGDSDVLAGLVAAARASRKTPVGVAGRTPENGASNG
jgi:bacteriocin biosynthesis cyclodehydratase domain-containing protein